VPNKKAPKVYGPYALGAQPLDLAVLAEAGLSLVCHLDVRGKVVGQTVIPSDEVPPEWSGVREKPTRPCGACGQDTWRLDKVTKTGWVCGRCFP
jgi:hypothetical protein